MAVLTKKQITVGGADSAGGFVAATATTGDKVVPGPGTFVVVKNASGGSINVTINDPNTPTPAGYTAFDPDATVAVGAGAERAIAIPDRFAGSDGMATIICSAVTSVTIQAFQT
jgi:hypothetical protein